MLYSNVAGTLGDENCLTLLVAYSTGLANCPFSSTVKKAFHIFLVFCKITIFQDNLGFYKTLSQKI